MPLKGGDKNGGHRGAGSALGGDPTQQPNQGDTGAQAPAAGEDSGARIRTGEIVGWRAWRCHSGRLWSVYLSHIVWPAAGLECTDQIIEYGWLGIHALKERGAAEEYMTWFRGWGALSWREALTMTAYEPRYFVFGQVAMWGTVIEHRRGYRAQFACPLNLVTPDDADLGEIRKYYGI